MWQLIIGKIETPIVLILIVTSIHHPKCCINTAEFEMPLFQISILKVLLMQTGCYSSLTVLYREYERRLALYKDTIWTCRCTGHINLTHEEALRSEQEKYRLLQQQFPEYFYKPVLILVHHSTLFSLVV